MCDAPIALGKSIGAGTAEEIDDKQMHRLTSGRAEMGDLEQELAAI